MATRELSSSVKNLRALDNSNITSDTNTDGVEIDTQGFNSVTCVLASGLGGSYTDGTYTVNVLESDTSGSGYAAADSSVIVSQSGNSAVDADNECAWVGYVGNKRYIKVRCVSTSTSSGANICGWVILGHPHNAPVTSN